MRPTKMSLVLVSVPFFLAASCKKNAEGAPVPPAPAAKPSLEKPQSLSERAPDVYRAKFATSKGDFVLEVHRDWAPLGADRFFNLVKYGYYNDVRFFRVVRGFMVQLGIHGKPELNGLWREQRIADDPVKKSNLRSFVSFATAGPGTRTTQLPAAWISWTRCTPSTAKARRRAGDRTRIASRTKATPTSSASFPSSTT